MRGVKTLDEVFNLLTDSQYRYSLPKVLDYIKAQKVITDKYGVQLMAYEGGQGLVDFKTTSHEQMPNPFIICGESRRTHSGIIR